MKLKDSIIVFLLNWAIKKLRKIRDGKLDEENKDVFVPKNKSTVKKFNKWVKDNTKKKKKEST